MIIPEEDSDCFGAVGVVYFLVCCSLQELPRFGISHVRFTTRLCVNQRVLGDWRGYMQQKPRSVDLHHVCIRSSFSSRPFLLLRRPGARRGHLSAMRNTTHRVLRKIRYGIELDSGYLCVLLQFLSSFQAPSFFFAPVQLLTWRLCVNIGRGSYSQYGSTFRLLVRGSQRTTSRDVRSLALIPSIPLNTILSQPVQHRKFARLSPRSAPLVTPPVRQTNRLFF